MSLSPVALFQSTHPRGVRLQQPESHAPKAGVSIHAPAWGATPTRPGCSLGVGSFNPRTRVGCDAPFAGQPTRPTGFNPRTRVGCDMPINPRPAFRAVSIHAPAWGATGVIVERLQALLVSIHAPAWGATCTVVAWAAWRVMFQSTHPRGVRPGIRDAALKLSEFQSTHPRGVRPVDGLPVRLVIGFNPRTRVGCGYPWPEK